MLSALLGAGEIDMNMKLEFQNGAARLVITPCDEWEQKMLGAVAKGGEKLDAFVAYKSNGHFSYGKFDSVSVTLSAYVQEST